MNKKLNLLSLLLVVALLVAGAHHASAEAVTEPLYLTVEELATYNGKDGQPAYVAVDGVIYDVSDSKLWADGGHMGQVEAGQELTKEITEISPHGLAVMERMPEVGRLVVELTSEELSAFNGKDGQPAYVAVDGLIYDVSPSDKWAGGEHMGQHQAGQDLTKEIKELSPHGLIVLPRVLVVGRLIVKLTAEELAAFDGLEGRAAYIAVDGTIYDVTEHPSWKSGKHAGVPAGQDVTEALAGSPHGDGVLSQAKKIGKLIP